MEKNEEQKATEMLQAFHKTLDEMVRITKESLVVLRMNEPMFFGRNEYERKETFLEGKLSTYKALLSALNMFQGEKT